jgi:hypothetical protein
MNDAALLREFLAGTVDLAAFDHRTHVRVTYLLLRDRPLPETLIALRDGLSALAARAGHPEKYHETITFAFAALVNERIQTSASFDWSSFAEANSDLFAWSNGSVLDRFYDPLTLRTNEARKTFLLPRQHGD